MHREESRETATMVNNRILNLCKEREMSIYRLCKLCDISPSAMSLMFSRNALPSITTIIRITNALEMPLAEFFCFDGSISNVNAKQSDLLKQYGMLSNRKQEVLDAFIKGLIESEKYQNA